MNNGLLDKATYSPVIAKAWKFMSTTALQSSGRYGYCQPVGGSPEHNINAASTSDFCVVSVQHIFFLCLSLRFTVLTALFSLPFVRQRSFVAIAGPVPPCSCAGGKACRDLRPRPLNLASRPRPALLQVLRVLCVGEMDVFTQCCFK